jgi:CheY-like chemotaxis protein
MTGRRRKGWSAMHIEIDEGIRSLLILEDEMIVAMLMEELVRSLGVRDVYICTETREALDLLATRAIDCAVLDLWVRDGTSMAVADALADRGIPFLFSSGSAAEALGERHARRPMISKPFLDDDFKLIVLDTWTLAQSQHAAEGHSSSRVAPFGATD